MKKLLLNLILSFTCVSALANDVWVVPYAAGGPSDVYTRAVTGTLEQKGKSTIIVENLPGASGTLGVNMAMAKKKFLVGSPSELMIAPHMQGNPKDAEAWKMVAVFGKTTLAWITGPNSKLKSIDDVLKKPKISIGNVGEGSLYHLINLEFAALGNLNEAVHIPYKNSPQLIQDVISGDLDIALVPFASPITDFIKAGKLKALAVTQNEPWPLEPTIPAIGANPKFSTLNYSTWIGLFADISYPQDQAIKWNADITNAIQDPTLQRLLQNTGTYTLAMNYADTQKFYQFEKEKYSRLMNMYKKR